MDRWKRHVSLLLVFILLFSLAGCSSGTEETDATPEGPRMEPGTYTASAYGFMGIEPLTVSVTVDGPVSDIEIDGAGKVPDQCHEKLMYPHPGASIGSR